ncbi:hypothetical protein ACMA1D_01015 [Streptomyces sp. 796.1]|uniref:hypothetical protein n=1 Tax=Streptomyces sp. 796.1 TaxID=3163029 RepID=UPI0039C97520
MDADTVTAPELARLDGGPADGTRVWVVGRAPVLQLSSPCELADGPGAVRVDTLYIYRLDGMAGDGLLRYGYDGASP